MCDSVVVLETRVCGLGGLFTGPRLGLRLDGLQFYD